MRSPTLAGLAAILAVWTPVNVFLPNNLAAVIAAAALGLLLGVFADSRSARAGRHITSLLEAEDIPSARIAMVLKATKPRMLPLTTVICHGFTLIGVTMLDGVLSVHQVGVTPTTTWRLWIAGALCGIYTLQELISRYIENHRVDDIGVSDDRDVPPEPPMPTKATARLSTVIPLRSKQKQVPETCDTCKSAAA